MSDIYSNHTVETAKDIIPFADWLIERAKLEEPVSVAVKLRAKKMAFATRDDAWVIDLKSPVAAGALGALRIRLYDYGQITIKMRDLATGMVDLSKVLSDAWGLTTREVFDTLVPLCVGDLTQAARCINHPVTPAKLFKRIEDDAFEVALLEPQYLVGIPPYYSRVGIPLAKIGAEIRLFGKQRQPDWTVDYSDLWIKVLTYYTQDPVLLNAVLDDEPVIPLLARIFGCSEDEAETILRWCACGMEMDVYLKRYPDPTRLPSNIPQWEEAIGRKLTKLVTSVISMKQSYYLNRIAETRFSRRLRPGHLHGEAVAFTIYGTVQDLVGVAAATLWNNRPASEVMLLRIDDNPDELIRIVGSGPASEAGKHVWLSSMQELAPLANPLGLVALKPSVVEAP